MPEINLLPEEEIKEATAKATRNKVTVYSMLTLAVAVAVSAVVFGYWLVLVRTDSQLTSQIGKLSSQIQSLGNVETLARVLKSKLSAIVTIRARSENYEGFLADVASLTPPGVTLSDLTVSDEKLVTITGTAATATDFSNLVTTLLAHETAKIRFSGVTVESLARDDKGEYQFTFSAKLKTK